MKAGVKVSLLTAVLGAILAGPAGAAPDPHELLGQALAGPKVPYSARVMLTQWYDGKTRAEEANVYFSPPEKSRWEFLSPAGGVRRVVVSDGQNTFILLPLRNEVVLGSAAKSGAKLISPEEELALLTRNYAVSVAGAEAVAGRSAWRIEISPAVEGKPSEELWVDKETHVILQVRRTSPNGQRASVSRFERFDQKKDMPEELFDLEVGSAVPRVEHSLDPDFLSLEELRQETGKAFDAPSELPGGFVFESADHYTEHATSVVHLRYTDGLAVLSLFETSRPVRQTRREEKLPAGRVLNWNARHRHFTLIGDVSDGLLEQIAARLKAR